MALRLTLKPNERIIVNGCILRNGPRRHVLEVENRADVLRGEEMLDAETARTPARRLAYHIQIALVSAAHREDFLPRIQSGLTELTKALPRFATTLTQVDVLVAQGSYYAAFRTLSEVITYEDRLFAQIEGDGL